MSVIIIEDLLRKVLNRESYPNRAVEFINSFRRGITIQGSEYWIRRYYRLYEIDRGCHLSYEKAEMSEEDWDYIDSLVRETPKDPFLLEKGNKEYVT